MQLMLLLLLLSSALLQVQVQLQACDWDPDLNPDQQLLSGPDPARLLEVSGPRACRAACCSDPDCDLALMGLPADGLPQCMLVRCRTTASSSPAHSSRFTARRASVCPGIRLWSPGEEARRPADGGRRAAEQRDQRPEMPPPPQVGSCRASFPRFFYNVSSQICSHFLFGGCHGNRNNFLTKGGVRRAGGVTVTLSSSSTEMSAEHFAALRGRSGGGSLQSGISELVLQRETGSCQTFIYGGCQGNKNNYETKQHCMDTCTVRVLPSSRKTRPLQLIKACTVTSDPGPCRAAFPMFYYDLNPPAASPSSMGGARKQEPLQQPGGLHDSLPEHRLYRCFKIQVIQDTRVARYPYFRILVFVDTVLAVFLFVTLAVVSTLLLTTLVIITLRRHRLSRHLSSFSDKEELLPDEQSSVESLNVSESPKPDQA
ncbi:hypothetical protein F7725_013673 [Dissostichus mawsoni]|uniref:BPTI/Kunitz inhibitor domain-containing protein n=1 Tax=Dissostichus mawsoni TaxID=36200 RepID=A0A7J5YU23_DISMA|nr:hypothetical protein F7725_013673 [Dissostichus mawsoni]